MIKMMRGMMTSKEWQQILMLMILTFKISKEYISTMILTESIKIQTQELTLSILIFAKE